MSLDPDPATLATFCHIGDHADFAYAGLHRMIAMSAPLNLWSPSSVMLRDSKCLIKPKEFLGYISDGVVRVAGREDWILSRTFRDQHPFHGAAWDRKIDGTLMKWAKEDSSKDTQHQRVIIAPPETGWDRASQHLTENPAESARILKIAGSPTAARYIPIGTLEASSRHASKYSGARADHERARAIIRDAYNHGAAFNEMQGRIPFLLKDVDKQFLKIIREPFEGGKKRSTSTVRDDENKRELARQVLELLVVLDHWGRNRRRTGDVRSFVRGGGRKELVDWISRWCDQLEHHRGRASNDDVLVELQSLLRRGKFPNSLRAVISHPAVASVGLFGVVSDVVGSLLTPSDPWNNVGIFASTVAVTNASLQSLGYISGSFSGPNWPFLYVSQTGATKRKIKTLHTILDETAASHRDVRF